MGALYERLVHPFASGVNATIGQRCVVITRPGSEDELYADAVGLVGGEAVLYPLGPLYGVAPDSIVQVLDDERSIGFSDSSMQGRVFDGLGRDVEASEIPAASACLWMLIRRTRCSASQLLRFLLPVPKLLIHY